jgi:hypothetical protein
MYCSVVSYQYNMSSNVVTCCSPDSPMLLYELSADSLKHCVVIASLPARTALAVMYRPSHSLQQYQDSLTRTRRRRVLKSSDLPPWAQPSFLPHRD